MHREIQTGCAGGNSAQEPAVPSAGAKTAAGRAVKRREAWYTAAAVEHRTRGRRGLVEQHFAEPRPAQSGTGAGPAGGCTRQRPSTRAACGSTRATGRGRRTFSTTTALSACSSMSAKTSSLAAWSGPTGAGCQRCKAFRSYLVGPSILFTSDERVLRGLQWRPSLDGVKVQQTLDKVDERAALGHF